jgi:hypothetical protein
MIVFGLILLLFPLGSRAACLPDSPVIVQKSASSRMLLMEETVQRFESVMVRDLPSDHDLIIRLDSLNPRINAEIIKEQKNVAISVWGGMLSHPKMSSNTLLLLLCHELGHFLGGPPLKSRGGWSSTEGQADYYSTTYCMKNFEVDEEQFFQAALSLSAIYSEVTQQSPPQLDQCDQTVVNRINYGYPGLQCRLDTLMAGWRQSTRPKCWFLE